MRVSTAFVGAVSLLAPAVAALPAASILAAFTAPENAWSVNTTISFPNSTAFEVATTRWNAFNNPTFSIVVTPGTAADVAKAVKIARQINFPFLGTGGRHSSSATLAAMQGGLEIDLSFLHSVSVNAQAATVTVGGGTRFEEIFDPVYAAGFETPTGSCGCPGMVGATIGGGIGRYQGKYGLIIDNMLSVDIVLANGTLLEGVSDQKAPDLFWAIRGAGANFGIITSATYRIHPLTNGGQVLNADFILPASSNVTYFDALEALEGTIPAELSTITIIEYNSTIGEPQILVGWVYIGPQEEGMKYIEPLLAMNPIRSNISMVPWNRLVDSALFEINAPICRQVSLKGYGADFRNLSSSTYQDIFTMLSNFYDAYPGGRGSTIEIEVFPPQGVAAVPEHATAYPWRDYLGITGISFDFDDAATEAAGDVAAQQIRGAFAATGGYDGLAVYVSYAHGDETLESRYGSNVPRLLELKKKWDPENVFRYFHNLA